MEAEKRVTGLGFVISAAGIPAWSPDGERLKSGQKLSDAYLNANLPVLRRRLHLAGVRLAFVLNEAFSETR
jgi:hypothetical protein